MKNDIVRALTNFGYLDIDRCNQVLDDTCISDSELAEYINDNFDGDIENLDIVAIAYDFVLMEVRSEIEKETGKDIINDLKENVNVAGNYCATSYDFTDKAQKETLELAKQVKKPSKALVWFINNIE